MSKVDVQRLHHNAYPIEDHEVTRHFYEDILGLPLVAAWAERAELGGKVRDYMHTFYELADGSTLAFFQLATEEDRAEIGRAVRTTFLDHLALAVDAKTQDELRARLEANGIPVRTVDHGYVKSIYVTDPDGLNLEFTVDAPDHPEISAYKRQRAHAELKKWMEATTLPTTTRVPTDHAPSSANGPHGPPAP